MSGIAGGSEQFSAGVCKVVKKALDSDVLSLFAITDKELLL